MGRRQRRYKKIALDRKKESRIVREFLCNIAFCAALFLELNERRHRTALKG